MIGFKALVAKLDEMFLWAVVNDLLGAGWLLYAWGRHFKTCRALHPREKHLSSKEETGEIEKCVYFMFWMDLVS